MAPQLNDERSKKTSAPETTQLTDALTKLVSDTYVLYFQTQSFHWNVRGPHFAALHALFQTQYEGLAAAVDLVAERVRALGVLAPTSLPSLIKGASLTLEHGAPSANKMVAALLAGHEQLGKSARDIAEMADRMDDAPTNDLMIQRAAEHEKTAWMLRATLEE